MTGFNWVDAALLVLVGLSAWGARGRGCLQVATGLAGAVGSLVVATALAMPLAAPLERAIPVPPAWGPPAAFLAVWLGLHSLYPGLTRLRGWPHLATRAGAAHNRRLAVIPGALQGLLLVGLLLTVLVGVPAPAFLLGAIQQSAVAHPLVETIRTLEQPLAGVFGPAIRAVRDAGTVDVPAVGEDHIELNFRVPLPTAAPTAEERMVDLINLERGRQGLTVLAVDPALRAVARAHARDLLQEGYFAHIGRDGRSPFDRMHAAGIRYRTAGENLALGPTADAAEAGLLRSLSHRANILNPRFVRIGVGTMDGGRDGQMFVQEFTD